MTDTSRRLAKMLLSLIASALIGAQTDADGTVLYDHFLALRVLALLLFAHAVYQGTRIAVDDY
jgi:hypothetical protein